MEHLRQNSKAVRRVELPSLGEYERQRANYTSLRVETPAMAAAV
jgi:hypothetical protein